MRAGLVDGRIRRPVIGRDDVVGEHPSFHFFAADVGEHVAVDLDARAEHLTAFLDHFLPLQRVVDDVAIFVREVIFLQHSADSHAPATGRFQIGDDFRLAHIFTKVAGNNPDAYPICHMASRRPSQHFWVATNESGGYNCCMPLNVLIAPDKFKGTLTAAAAAAAIARGWKKARPTDRIERLPISDGGDGFGAALGDLLRARTQSVKTLDAAHCPCKSTWWWDTHSKTAVVESARVIGLAMLPPGKFHPFQLDTFGLGKVLQAAQAKGARRIIIGIGGSATNDGGFGLARALGWRFADRQNQTIENWADLYQLATVYPPDTKKFKRVVAAVDVQNRLLGRHGASRVYGPQKGLRQQDFELAERCLGRLAKVIKRQLGCDFAATPGSGSAGGLGFGLLAFLEAHPEPGFELFAQLAKLNQKLRPADLVITGEGAIDASTLMGKGVGQLAQLASRNKIPCIGLGGAVSRSRQTRSYFHELYGLTDLTDSTKAKARPAFWLERLAERAAKACDVA